MPAIPIVIAAPAPRIVSRIPLVRVTVREVRSPFYVTDAEIDAFLQWQKDCEFIRETDPNCGPEVEEFQQFCYGKRGDSWCADMQSWGYCHVWPHIPLARSGSCQGMRQMAAKLGWTLPKGETPRRGDIGLCIDARPATIKLKGRTHAHHVYALQSDPRATGVFDSSEGNTNPGGGSNGFGVFYRSSRSTRLVTPYSYYEFIRFPRQAA